MRVINFGRGGFNTFRAYMKEFIAFDVGSMHS